jgi:hypothetical protein
MRLSEIIEELPKLTTEEKKQLRDLLDSDLSWSQEEEEILEEGLRSRGEEPMVPWEELKRRLLEKYSGT